MKKPVNEQYIKTVSTLYERYNSLKEVGTRLGITRERVRQILSNGNALGIITYNPSTKKDKKSLEELKNKISRELFIEKLTEFKNLEDALPSLDINTKEAKTLKKLYNIKKEDYYSDKYQKKYINEYLNFVDILGHHPSTTELQSTNKGRILYNGISKYWKNFSSFRKEFGIEKNDYFMDETGKNSWQEAMLRGKETRQKHKEEKKELILKQIEENGEIDKNNLAENLGLSHSSISIYLNELEEQNLISKASKHLKNYYFLAST